MKKQKGKAKAVVNEDDDSGLSSKEKLLKQIAKDKAGKAVEAEAHWLKIRKHVMLGEMNGKNLVGFHSIQKLGQQGCVAQLKDGEMTRLSMGCYKRSIESAGGGSSKESTFFPDNWTEADIKAAVVDAYQHQVKTIGRVTLPKGNGMSILFMGGDTAFPYFE